MENQLKKRKMSPTSDSDVPVVPEPQLLIKRLSKNAKLPTRGSALAAGYDLYRYVKISIPGDIVQGQLYSAEKKVVPAHGKALVDTQLSIAVPPGTYGRVAPRSGLGLSYKLKIRLCILILALYAASKFMIDTGAGVVDADYRGVIFVLLFNHSDKDFQGMLQSS